MDQSVAANLNRPRVVLVTRSSSGVQLPVYVKVVSKTSRKFGLGRTTNRRLPRVHDNTRVEHSCHESLVHAFISLTHLISPLLPIWSVA